ncbi:hypothetical protein HBI69_163620 [Parastagonospora nodorum]|nr:hypothetical protein HBI69_163620 [Parastagonospora nodorum]
MILLRQTRERSSRDSICDAITLTSDEYETLYAESLRTTTAKEHIRQIARVVALRQNSPLQSTAPNSRLRTITHLARRKMRCNYNPETRLQNNDGYAEAMVYSARQSNTDQILIRTDQLLYVRNDLATEYKDISSLNYTQFIQTLEREIGFEDKRSGIYYYTKTADIATKLYRATFVIKPLI